MAGLVRMLSLIVFVVFRVWFWGVLVEGLSGEVGPYLLLFMLCGREGGWYGREAGGQRDWGM